MEKTGTIILDDDKITKSEDYKILSVKDKYNLGREVLRTKIKDKCGYELLYVEKRYLIGMFEKKG